MLYSSLGTSNHYFKVLCKTQLNFILSLQTDEYHASILGVGRARPKVGARLACKLPVEVGLQREVLSEN